MEKGTPAEVVEILNRTGVYGEIVQVLCKILEGPEQGRVKRRNVKGNPQKGDVIVLLSTEREAKDIKAR
ncbi:MAG: 30S ribosomal protein S28e [archaeon]